MVVKTKKGDEIEISANGTETKSFLTQPDIADERERERDRVA